MMKRARYPMPNLPLYRGAGWGYRQAGNRKLSGYARGQNLLYTWGQNPLREALTWPNHTGQKRGHGNGDF